MVDERTVSATAAQLQLAALDKTDWDIALGAILRIDSRALAVDRTSFWSLCHDPSGIYCELGYVASVDGLERGALLRSADVASYMRELDRARIIELDDIETDPRAHDLIDYCRARHIGAMLDVPVTVSGQLAGVLCHEHVGGPRHWSPLEIELALSAGAAVAVALEARRRVRAEAGERRARFLANASHVLGGSLDEKVLAKAAVELTLPTLADWTALDLFEPGKVTRAAMAHVNPAMQPIIDAYLARFSPNPEGPHATVLVHRLKQAAVVPEVTDERLGTLGIPEEQLAVLHRLGIRSAILVPFDNGVVDGVMMLVSAGRWYDKSDLALAEEYRDRVCAALTNARLYTRSQEALHARDEFLRMASHELRTPLTALRVSCERLVASMDGVTPEVAATAERTLRASRRLSRLVTHMLDAAIAEQHRPSIERTHGDLVPAVRSAVDDVVQTTVGAKVELLLPDHLVGDWDEERVQEIVINLVDNAVKYGDGRPARVRLTRDGHDAVLSVADCGPGIAPEALPRLFEAYERGDDGHSHGGLGLGLFIVKQLVDAHGGSIDVRTRPEEGTELVVHLPGATA